MVVTFLTSTNYSESAENLDDSRLRKQCVEAFQILNVLNDLHLIAERLNLPKCPDIELPYLYRQENWVKKVWDEYRECAYYYYYSNGILMKSQKNNPFFTLNQTYILNKHYFIVDTDTIKVLMSPADYRKNYDPNYQKRVRVEKYLYREDVIIKEQGDRIIKLGYAHHPATRMWLGYENSLALYLNAHLDEYYKRSGKYMNIPKRFVWTEIRPWWIKDQLINSHKASLLRKNNDYYKEIFEIDEKYLTLGYVWPFSLTEIMIEELFEDRFHKRLFADVHS